jgi:acetyl esterase/lipase
MTNHTRIANLAFALAALIAALTCSTGASQEARIENAPDGSYFGFMDGVKHGAIPYRKGEHYELKCDVYVPKGAGPFPAILAIHGGAWRSGTKVHMLRHAFKFCNAGFVVVCIDYRHAPEFPFPAQIQDAFAALRFMNDNAEQYRINTDQVFGFGYSAGGHLISLLATTSEADWFAPEDLDPNRTPCPALKAVVAGGAPCDFDWIDQDSTALTYWLSATKAQDAELYRRASPICHVSKNTPPFLLFHGCDDWLVPPQCADRMADALSRHGVQCEVNRLKGCGHLEAFSQLQMVDQAVVFFHKQLGTKVSGSPAGGGR